MSLKEVYYDPQIKSVVFLPRSAVATSLVATLPATAFAPSGLTQGMVPVGSIHPWIPGYFTNTNNGGYSPVLIIDTMADANNYLKQFGFMVCDGSQINESDSSIWNASGRYLPNISDKRFFNGSLTVGGTSQAGSNVLTEHIHCISLTAAGQTLAAGSYSSGVTANHYHNDIGHQHAYSRDRSSAGGSSQGDGFAVGACGATTSTNSAAYGTDSANHNHDMCHDHSSSPVCGTVGGMSTPSTTNNRPLYLRCFYIVRVK